MLGQSGLTSKAKAHMLNKDGAKVLFLHICTVWTYKNNIQAFRTFNRVRPKRSSRNLQVLDAGTLQIGFNEHQSGNISHKERDVYAVLVIQPTELVVPCKICQPNPPLRLLDKIADLKI
jgi:hypothetical protein